MATISSSPFSTQNAPTRVFILDPVKSVDEFRNYRDLAYGILVGKIQQKGQDPSAYDVRPVSPVDDFALLTGTGAANHFASDWSVAATNITDVTGALTTTGGGTGGNTIVKGTMPQDRFLDHFGLEIQTPGTPAEVAWEFQSGANVKSAWLVSDLKAYENPRAVTREIPVYGPSEQLQEVVYAVAAQPIVDVLYSLWGEPTGIIITASNIRA